MSKMLSIKPNFYFLKSIFVKPKSAINRFNSDMHHELKLIRASEAKLKEKLDAVEKELKATKESQENYKLALRRHAVSVVRRRLVEIEQELKNKWSNQPNEGFRKAS